MSPADQPAADPVQTNGRWQFWIDRGGTFTDIIGYRPGHPLIVKKLLSDNPSVYEDAATAGIELVLAERGGGSLDESIASIRMGTTVATNALLERKGEPTVLVITQGLADALRIGYQTRPNLFARHIQLPEPLYSAVIEMRERIGADGTILKPLDVVALSDDLRGARAAGIKSVAIVGLHGYQYSHHEQVAGDIARKLGFNQVTMSHDVTPTIRLVPRGDTSVADAYLSPVLRRYVERVRRSAGNVRLELMQSNGGLTEAGRLRGANAILSGPAGGIVGAVAAAKSAGCEALVSFDMGGTSTDVAYYAGELERSTETVIAGTRLCTPMVAIHTIAAGGGSVCQLHQGRFVVGPESAGADPGPASYGKGGPLTVTDCQVLLGRLNPSVFPKVFGVGQDQPLAAKAAGTVARQVAKRIGDEYEDFRIEAIAEGFIRVAVAEMARAIKSISVQRGRDLKDHSLVAFGGAGGQHACALATELEVSSILIPDCAGVLSAWGIGRASLRTLRRETFEEPMSDVAIATVTERAEVLAAEVKAELVDQGASTPVQITFLVGLRGENAEATLEVSLTGRTEMLIAFAEAHRAEFGFEADIESVTFSHLIVEGTTKTESIDTGHASQSPQQERPLFHAPVWFSEWCDTPFFDRYDLPLEEPIFGPAIISDEGSTTVVEPGWSAKRHVSGHLVLTHESRAHEVADDTRCDPVRLEVFNGAYMSIAEQMGHVLRNTARSVNIRERLDYSCAVFDADGALIANAPHMPVHLGSMGESVRAILDTFSGDMCQGDAFVVNDPYRGGTHLPDITVVSAVFDGSGNSIQFFVASRGHHADVGGTSPGSMPSDSTHIDHEGVLIPPTILVKNGRLQRDVVARIFDSGRYPARNPAQNLADLEAQIASNRRGAKALAELVERHGWRTVLAYTHYVRENAETAVRGAIGVLQDGEYRVAMDDGSAVAVSVSVDRACGEATIDFTGTSRQQQSNFNAPYPVVRAAVLYVFRSLVASDIPMNEGCLTPLRIVVPEGSMLRPRYPAAVAAGNVETSQAIVDCLYGALGLLAASQGTMNNLTFGNPSVQYYETVCGGAGAGPGFDGASAVHTHMTNSRLTDPEVLESRFPVVLDEFSVRKGSGGAGLNNGGDGVRRRLVFTEPVTLSLLANRHVVPPFGLRGGQAGSAGAASVVRADGSREPLASRATVEIEAGDAFILETPGGGGFGAPVGDADE